MKRTPHITYILTVLLVILLSSCFENNFVACPPEDTGVRVHFTYDIQGEASEIDRISLFVFDGQGILIGLHEETDVVMTPEYNISLPLDAGNYRFVVWANLRDCYNYTNCTINKTTFSNLELYLQKEEDNTVRNAPHPLFHGWQEEAVITGDANQHFSIPLQRNTNTIQIQTSGLPPTDTEYELAISDYNGHYTFENSFASDTEEIHYISSCTKDEQSQLCASLTVLRLAADRKQPILRIRKKTPLRSEEVLYQANLVDLILKLQEKDPTLTFENTHEYNFLLKFDTDLNVTVGINGWEITENVTEI
ncbi:MAG: FimB/Mfa2 family fimbrial subunit [Bacteroides xylanisolvens]